MCSPTLPAATRRASSSVQAARSTFGWERYVGSKGRVIGMTTFGASAPLKELQRKFGFEPARVTAVAKELLGRGGIRVCRLRPVRGHRDRTKRPAGSERSFRRSQFQRLLAKRVGGRP